MGKLNRRSGQKLVIKIRMLFSMQLKKKQVKFELRSRIFVQSFRWSKNIFPRNIIRKCYYQISLGFAFSFNYLVLSFLIILSTMKSLPTSCVVLSFRANLLQKSFNRKPKLAYGNRIFLFIKKEIFLFIKKMFFFNQKNISFHQKNFAFQ